MMGYSIWSTQREKALTVACAILVFLAVLGGTIGSISSIRRFIDTA
jgi:hypothetical protein